MATAGRSLFLRIFQNVQKRSLFIPTSHFSTKEPPPVDDLDKPVQYTTSKAAAWKAEHSFRGTDEEDLTPWYQPHVVCLSVAIFMLYFAVLREESDVDEGLSMSLYDRVDGLEEVQLKNVIAYYKENDPSYDRGPMERRLKELLDLKK